MAIGLLPHHNLRGSLLLFLCFVVLATICGIAALSTVMRPARWADRTR